MMKRKILAVTIPVVGCLTVVGSGFSAWYFSDTINDGDNRSSAVNVVVTDEVIADEDNLKVDTTGTVLGDRLILDQGGLRNYSPDSGIMFGAIDATETTVNNNANWHFTVEFTDDQDLTLYKIYDAGLRVRIVADITLDGALSNYITFQDNLNLSVQPTIGGSTTADISKTDTKLEIVYIVAEENVEKETKNATWTFDIGARTNLVGNDYKNELLKYKDSDSEPGVPGKPNATGEPYQMEQALIGATITFKVQAFIEENK